jgi:cell division protein FtsL
MTAVRTPPAATARARTAVRPTTAGGATALRRPQPALRRVDTAPRVAPSRRARAPRLWLRRLVALGAVLTLVMVFSAVVFQALLVSGQGELDGLERRIVAQEQILANQQLDITRLESPTRVVGAAQERLGMVAPAEIVYLRPDAADDQAIAVSPPAPATSEPVAGADE